jgi:hypothetical protein
VQNRQNLDRGLISQKSSDLFAKMSENFRPGIIFQRINLWTGRVCSAHHGEGSEGNMAWASPELGQRCGSRATVVQNREAAALGEDTAQVCREGKEVGERCGATRGCCSPFIGVGGASGRKCRWVTAGDLRPTPLMAGEGVNGASRGGIKAGE